MPTESITLYYREGSSDKVYNASIEDCDGGYKVNVAYGRRGSTFQTGSKTNMPVSFESAKKIYDKLVKEKTAKGYTPRLNGTPYAHTGNEQRSTGILPQLLNAVDENQLEDLFDDPSFWMQEKKDGKRVIIQIAEKITGINRKGLVIGLPESIVTCATEIGLPCTLDGECIGDKFYTFDLLEFNGVNYRKYPYSERYETLRCLLKKSNGTIELVPSYYSPEIKRAEFALLKKARAEGVVFKKHNAPYTPGRPARFGPQLKFKFVATGTFIVAGVNKDKRSSDWKCSRVLIFASMLGT